MDMNERNKAIAERRKAMMEGDFNPGYTPEHTPPAEARMVNAVEYAAYQLGQMNRTLQQILKTLEAKT
jgi:hypothetical protein